MKETGGAAFPNKSVYGRCEACGWDENLSVPGMTLRDYFAAKAIQGTTQYNEYPNDLMIRQLVENGYRIADAMIEERGKQ